jgi:hypothetical protein
MIEQFRPQLSNLWSLEICPTFTNFKFCDDDNALDFDLQVDPKDYCVQADFTMAFSDDDNDQDNHDHQYGGMDEDFGNEERYQNLEEIKTMPTFSADPTELISTFAYVDKSMNRSWAGPHFWKARAITGF